jgi:hypothetical protein
MFQNLIMNMDIVFRAGKVGIYQIIKLAMIYIVLGFDLEYFAVGSVCLRPIPATE